MKNSWNSSIVFQQAARHRLAAARALVARDVLRADLPEEIVPPPQFVIDLRKMLKPNSRSLSIGPRGRAVFWRRSI
ncbi:MAG: hypothetical protein R3F11_17720 [Verrucomicrobiales bacterium]